MRDRGPLSSGLVLVVMLIAGHRIAAGQDSVQTNAANAKATVAAAVATQAPTTAAPAPTATAAPPTKEGSAENLRLLGIVRGGNSSGALIGLDDKQEIFHKGDAVFDHGTLKDVRDDSVVIHSGDNDVTLKVVKEAPPPPAEPAAEQVVDAPPPMREAAPPPPTGPLSRVEARAALKDFAQLLAKADAKRVSVGGGHGVQLGKVDSSSFLAKLGLRSGDILQKLDGTAIDDVDRVPDLSSAADGKELTVTYSRNDIGLTIARPLQ